MADDNRAREDAEFLRLNSLLGLRNDFAEAARAVASSAGRGRARVPRPYTAVWYASTTNYHEATLFNALSIGTTLLGGIRLNRTDRASLRR